MLRQHLQKPEIYLYLFAAAVPISFAAWQSMINNFAIEQAASALMVFISQPDLLVGKVLPITCQL